MVAVIDILFRCLGGIKQHLLGGKTSSIEAEARMAEARHGLTILHLLVVWQVDVFQGGIFSL